VGISRDIRYNGNGFLYYHARVPIIMKILYKYQLDIIFLFFALILILWTYFFGLKYLGADPHDFEWIVAGPLLLIYFLYLIYTRNKIDASNRRKLTAKTLFYWTALGVSMFLTYSTPVAARDYWSIRLFFIIFTLFLADSYWDFKTIKIKNIFRKKI